MNALLLAVLVATAGPLPSGNRTSLFVDDFTSAAALAPTAGALTNGMCAALSKDARLDVACAPDVKQILQFAATSALVGSSGGAADKVQARLDAVAVVVTGAVRKEGTGYVLAMSASSRAPESSGIHVVAGKPLVTVEERAADATRLLERVPSLAARLAAAVLPPPPVPPPPAPLSP
jgi:hypothetical protein